MKPILAAAFLLLSPLPLAPHAAGAVLDPDEFSVCVVTSSGWEVCVSRDHTWYCYAIWTGMPPGIGDCVQFIGP